MLIGNDPARVPAEFITSTQRVSFTLALAVGSRAIFLRDWMLGRIRQPIPPPGVELKPLSIESGNNRLQGLYAAPTARPANGAVLICHGIGGVVEQWVPIQHLLAAQGVASMVFDYSGYGRSTGWPTPAQFEYDAIAAYAQFSELTSLPISLLGFSLGTGIASAVLHRVPAHRLVLCAGFTSFRAAARCVGIPPFLSAFVPDVWNAEAPLRAATQPVFVVHSTHDRLFPVAMGQTLAAWCGNRARLRIVQGLRHTEPFYKPTADYWNPIAEFLTADER